MQRFASSGTVHVLLAISLALVIRVVAFAVPIDPFRAPDSQSFVSLAASFSNEGRLAYTDPGAPGVQLRAFRSLLYPVFFAAVGGSSGHAGVALALQALFGVGVVGCVLVIARRAVGRDVAIVAGWIGAVYWTSIFFERQILTESLYTFFLCAGVALALVNIEGRDRLRPWTAARVVTAGVILGLATLTRPVGLAAIFGILAVWAVALLISCRRRNTSLSPRRLVTILTCLLIGATIVIAPAVIRNQRVLGRTALLTSGGMNFWAGNGRGTIQDAWTIMEKGLPHSGEVEMDRWFYRDTWDHGAEILHHVPRLFATKLWALLAPSTREFEYLPFRFLLPFTLIGMAVVLRLGRWTSCLVLAVIISHFVALLAFVPWPRYRTPIDPFLYLLAAAGLVYLWKRGGAVRWVIPALLGINLLALLSR
jgi:hypothetical protein